MIKEKDFYYLDYVQVMIYMHKIRDIRNNNEFFHDGISQTFENYVVKRTGEIALSSSLSKKLPNADKYKVSKSMIKYLTNLTGVNVLDEKVVEEYTPLIKAYEENLLKQIRENNSTHSKKRA